MPIVASGFEQASSRFLPPGPQRIHAQALFRLSRKSSTGSMCQ